MDCKMKGFIFLFDGNQPFNDAEVMNAFVAILNKAFDHIDIKASEFDMYGYSFPTIEFSGNPEEWDFFDNDQFIKQLAVKLGISLCGYYTDNGLNTMEKYYLGIDGADPENNAISDRLLARFMLWETAQEIGNSSGAINYATAMDFSFPFQISSTENPDLFWDEVTENWVNSERASRYSLGTLPTNYKTLGNIVIAAEY